MIEMQLEQGSQEWLDFRRNHRMASETPAVMGLSPYQSPSHIRKVKLGNDTVFVNDAMRQGVAQEPIARKAYEERFELIRPAVFVNGQYGASLDGINIDQDVIWECKTPVNGFASDRAKLALKGELTPYDFAQVQHQLMVTGAKYCDFCVWDAKEQDFIIAKVNPEPDFWLSIEMEWDAFWETLGLRTDKAWLKLAQQYKLQKAVVELATQELDQIKTELQSLLTGEMNEGGGVKVQRIKVSGSTDWKKVQEHFLKDVVLDEFKKPDTYQYRINEMKE